MERKFKCLFYEGWDCPILAAEVPLDVCRLCLDARNNHSRVIRRTERVEVRELRVGDREGAREALVTTDRLFIEGKISLDEYVHRRGELTKALETPVSKE